MNLLDLSTFFNQVFIIKQKKIKKHGLFKEYFLWVFEQKLTLIICCTLASDIRPSSVSHSQLLSVYIKIKYVS